MKKIYLKYFKDKKKIYKKKIIKKKKKNTSWQFLTTWLSNLKNEDLAILQSYHIVLIDVTYQSQYMR